jgi:hypothetical protein
MTQRLPGWTLVVAIVLSVMLSASTAFADAAYVCGSHNGATCQAAPRDDNGCYTNTCFGRCGPACGWSVLGNTYTGACQSHDQCIKNNRCSGVSAGQSHINCAGLLGSAVKSYIQSQWYSWSNWIGDSLNGKWDKVQNR